MLWSSGEARAANGEAGRTRQNATVRTVFIYPPSSTFAGPDGWWSWPGNEFDAEGRQKQYMAALRDMEKRLGVTLAADNSSVANAADAELIAQELRQQRPDGLLLVMFYNVGLAHANVLLKTADELGIPAVFFIGLGVKHGPVKPLRRPGLYLIQSLDNFEAIESGLRMINARKLMSQSRLLSITEAPEPREGSSRSWASPSA